MKLRFKALLLSSVLCGGIATGAILGGIVAPQPVNAASADTYRALNLFGDVFERVRNEYVEAPNDQDLVESAINGMLTSLDPHSSFLNAKSFRDMQVQTRGEFGGLGIEVTMENGLVKVVAPIDDTPAARAGVRPSDIITQLDDEPVLGMTLQQAVEKMRGLSGTPIRLKVQRAGLDEPLEIKITRDVIRIKAVKFRVEGDIGYIRISQFNEQTTDSLKDAIANITKAIPAEKLKGFVVDMRNNPGGLLDQAISVSDAFLDKGEIVSTRGRRVEETHRFYAKPGDLTNGKPVLVLVNGAAASASEIVAGALQDQKRSLVLGSRSFGKGSVQTIIPIGGNGALRITTARYYTPSGKSIQAKGISPDIFVAQEVPPELKGKVDIKGEASLPGHLKNDNEESSASSAYVPPEPKDDKQIQYAYDLLHGVVKHAAFAPDKKFGVNPDFVRETPKDITKAAVNDNKAPAKDVPKAEEKPTPALEAPKLEVPALKEPTKEPVKP